MKIKTKRILAFLCAVVLVATTFFGNTYMKKAEAASDLEPISVDGFKNVTISDFVDADGNAMPEGEYNSGVDTGFTTQPDGTEKANSHSINEVYSLSGQTNFDKQLLSMKVKFSHASYKNSIVVCGAGEWQGFNIHAANGGQILRLDTSWAGSIASLTPIDMYASDAGVDSFLDEFLLQLSFEYDVIDDNNKADLTIGVYINGNLYKNKKFTIADCNMSNSGNKLALYVEENSDVATTLTVNSVEWPPEPVQLEGFENLTISDFTDGNGYAMVAKPYSEPSGHYSVSRLETLDKTLFSTRITFHEGANSIHESSLMLGGKTSQWESLNICTSTDGKELYIEDTWCGEVFPYNFLTDSRITINAQQAEVENFIGNEFLLQLSFEYADIDANNKATFKLGVYIEGKLYGNYEISNWDMNYVGTDLYTYRDSGGITLENVNIRKEPIVVDGFDNLTISDFTKEDGTELMAGEYANPTYSEHDDYTVSGLTNFDNKLISMYITFEGGGYQNSLILAGCQSYGGFNIRPYDDSGTQLVIDKTWSNLYGGTLTSTGAQTLSATTAGVSSFVNNEFLLQISFEYVTETDSTTTLKMGVYIDGKLYNDQVFTFASCDMNGMGTHLGLYRQVVGQSIIVGNEVKFGKFAGYTEVTVEDFVDASGNVMESKAYQCADPINGTLDDFVLADGTSFHKKLISMNVKFNHDGTNTWNTRIDIGRDSEGPWEGFSLYTNGTGSALMLQDMYGTCEKDSNGKIVVKGMSASTAGISSFLKNQFLLQMTFDIGDFDGEADTDDIQIGVYINGTLYNDEKFIFYDCTAYGNHIGLYRQADYSTIIVGSVNEEFPADPGIQPSARYEKLTFGHFGIVNKTYPHIDGDFAASGKANGKESLNETVICGNIKMVGDQQFYIVWGGQQSNWEGLFMFATPDQIQMKWDNATDSVLSATGSTLSADIALADGKKFIGDEYHVMLSAEVVNFNGDETAEADDIKIGIWFDGVLYNQQYFYVLDKGSELGNYFSVYCGNNANVETDSVTFGSEMDLLEQPDAALERVSFTEFGIKNGTYNSQELKIGTYLYGDTVDGIVLCGKVKFNDQNTAEDELGLVIGGTENDIWTTGIRLTMWKWSSGKLVLYAANAGQKTFDINKTGVDYFNEEVDLMWSIQLVDHAGDGNVNDLKVGVWFNGFLYENSYIYVDEFGTVLGNAFAPYATNDSNIVLNYSNQYAKVPNEEFDKLTFSDFGYETGVYTKADATNDMYEKTATNYTTLDKVVFSGDFRLSDSGDYQIIYGGKSAWNGLRFIISSSGAGYFGWFHNFNDGKGDQTQGYIGLQATDVGLNSFTKETFNLKISTELVDNNGDGKKNDIKVGLWVNDVLVKNNGNDYAIITDWSDLLGNYLSIYYGTADTSAMLRNVDSYQKNPYYFEVEDVASYRESGTYPEEPGYIFAGWYKDAEYTEWINNDETGTSAWAKFLEDDVLSVQSQVKVTTTDANGDGKLDVTSNSTDLRVATTVDGLEYRRISFYLQKQKDGIYGAKFDTATVSDENARMVYEKLYALEDKTTVTEHKPTIFTWQSDYFKTFTITNIPSSDYGTKIKVTPYWITMDGTRVEGKAVETCVNDYTNNKSQAVSVDFIGDNTLPITGYHGPYVVGNANDAMLFPDYITDEYFKLIADSGVNVIISSNLDYAKYPAKMKKALELGEKYGIGIYVQDSKLLELTTVDDVRTRLAEYDDYESFVGIYLVDEPGTSSYQSDASHLVSTYSKLAGFLDELKVLTYANLFPVINTDDRDFWDKLRGQEDILSDDEKSTYSAYASEVNTTLKPAVLMWDCYPFVIKRNDDGTRASEVTTTQPEYFWNMGEIRRQAQAANKPFWAYVQAGANWNDQQDYFTTNKYAPSKGQFKWNMNTALAFGAQGIQYFPLVQPYHFAYAGSSAADKQWDFERNGLIGAFGNPTDWYDYAQEANAHVAAMDHILMNSYNEKIIAIGSAVDDASGANGVTTTVSYNDLTGATGNALIGCFNYEGKTALYVVNYDYDTAGTVILTFSSDKNITMIKNAETTEVATSNKQLTLSNMTAGEGILLVIE